MQRARSGRQSAAAFARFFVRSRLTFCALHRRRVVESRRRRSRSGADPKRERARERRAYLAAVRRQKNVFLFFSPTAARSFFCSCDKAFCALVGREAEQSLSCRRRRSHGRPSLCEKRREAATRGGDARRRRKAAVCGTTSAVMSARLDNHAPTATAAIGALVVRSCFSSAHADFRGTD